MRLIGVDIRNFRSCRNVSLKHMGDYNVLIGENNAGKTAIVEAITLAHQQLMKDCKLDVLSVMDYPTRRDFYKNEEQISISLHYELSHNDCKILNDKVAAPTSVIMSYNLAFVFNDLAIPKSNISFNQPELVGKVFPSRPEPDGRVALLTQKFLAVFRRDITKDEWSEIKAKSKTKNDCINELNNYIRNKYGIDMQKLDNYFHNLMPTSLMKYSYDDYKNALLTSDQLGDSLATRSGVMQSKIDIADWMQAKDLINDIWSTNTWNIIKPLLKSNYYYYIKAPRTPLSQDEIEKLSEKKRFRQEREEVDAFCSKVEKLLGSRIDIEAISRDAPEPLAIYQNCTLDASGYGIRAGTRIIHDICLVDPAVIAIEEPELHLHPILQSDLYYDLGIESKKRQVIISTHSASFLDLLMLENLYIIRKIGDDTKVFNCSKKSLVDYCVSKGAPENKTTESKILPFYSTNATTDILNGFFSKTVVLVEGPTEEYAIPELLKQVNGSLTAGISVISVGGNSKIAKWYRLFTAFGIPVYVIIDNDKDNNDNNKAFTDALSAVGKSETEIQSLNIAEGWNVDDDVCVFGYDYETAMKSVCKDYDKKEEEAKKQNDYTKDNASKPIIARHVAREINVRQYDGLAKAIDALAKAIEKKKSEPPNTHLDISIDEIDEALLNKSITPDSLAEYTLTRFPHKEVRVSLQDQLISDLNSDKYKTIQDIHKVVVAAEDAVAEFEKEMPANMTVGTDHLTKSLGFVDIEFRTKHKFGKPTRELFERYQHLVKPVSEKEQYAS